MEDLVRTIKELQRRIDKLERQVVIRELVIPADGKLTVDTQTTDPTVENGRIYYNSTTHKLRKCINGVWADVG